MAKLTKSEVSTLLLQLGSFVLNKFPGFTEETLRQQVKNAGLHLYESEVESIAEKSKKFGVDPQQFVDLLYNVGAILEGTRPAFGGKRGEVTTRINSRERAEQVVTSTEPGAVEKFMELMSELIAIAKEADKLIAGKGKISLAIKNEGDLIKRRKQVQEAEDEE